MQNSREDFRAGEVAQLVKGLSSVYDMTLGLLPSTIENQICGACLSSQHSGGRQEDREFRVILKSRWMEFRPALTI